MRKILLVTLLAIALTGCGGLRKILTIEDKVTVVMPPQVLFDNCPDDIEWPEISNNPTGQDPAVKLLITRLYEKGEKCELANKKIKEFLENAKREIEEN